jgi:hypothetical protein
MKITPKELLKGKNYAKFIASHPIFDRIDKVRKVFPSIGLPNCEDNKLTGGVMAATKSAQHLLAAIDANLEKRAGKLSIFADKHPNMGAKRAAKLADIQALINALRAELATKTNECLLVEKDCVKLKLPSDITIPGEKKPAFKAGARLFSVYGKINELLTESKFAKMRDLDAEPTFKEFSKDNVPNGGLKIVFSSDGKEGLWDIATMSMRGVSSCQSWNNGAYKHSVIGSMLDEFVGIIYLTSGGKYNEYGTKMIRRCIVRFVVNSKTKQPYIALDQMYPAFDSKTLAQFKDFISSRVRKDIDVHYAPYLNGTQIHKSSYIPLTKVRETLAKFPVNFPSYDGNSIIAYQDVKFPDKHPIGEETRDLFQKNAEKKANRFAEQLILAAVSGLKNIDTNLFPENVRPIIQALIGENIPNGFFNCSYQFPVYMKAIAREFIASVKIDDFTNSDTYVRRIYYSYFNRREEVFMGIKNKLVKQINSDCVPGKKNKIKPDHLSLIMQVILAQIDETMKDKLRKLVSKRKFSGASPIPEPKTAS